jgi:hypothetical protein
LFPLFPAERIRWQWNLWNQLGTGWGKSFCEAEMRRASSFLKNRLRILQGKEVWSVGSEIPLGKRDLLLRTVFSRRKQLIG